MDELRRILNDLQIRVEYLEKGLVVKKITIPADSTGFLIIKIVTTDPVSPVNNEIWINSTSNQLKWNNSGTIKAVTLS